MSRRQIASDGDGDAVAVWYRGCCAVAQLEARTISAAGVLGATQSLSSAGQWAGGSQIASNVAADAAPVWSCSDGSTNRIQASQRP